MNHTDQEDTFISLYDGSVILSRLLCKHYPKYQQYVCDLYRAYCAEQNAQHTKCEDDDEEDQSNQNIYNTQKPKHRLEFAISNTSIRYEKISDPNHMISERIHWLQTNIKQSLVHMCGNKIIINSISMSRETTTHNTDNEKFNINMENTRMILLELSAIMRSIPNVKYDHNYIIKGEENKGNNTPHVDYIPPKYRIMLYLNWKHLCPEWTRVLCDIILCDRDITYTQRIGIVMRGESSRFRTNNTTEFMDRNVLFENLQRNLQAHRCIEMILHTILRNDNMRRFDGILFGLWDIHNTVHTCFERRYIQILCEYIRNPTCRIEALCVNMHSLFDYELSTDMDVQNILVQQVQLLNEIQRKWGAKEDYFEFNSDRVSDRLKHALSINRSITHITVKKCKRLPEIKWIQQIIMSRSNLSTPTYWKNCVEDYMDEDDGDEEGYNNNEDIWYHDDDANRTRNPRHISSLKLKFYSTNYNNIIEFRKMMRYMSSEYFFLSPQLTVRKFYICAVLWLDTKDASFHALIEAIELRNHIYANHKHLDHKHVIPLTHFTIRSQDYEIVSSCGIMLKIGETLIAPRSYHSPLTHLKLKYRNTDTLIDDEEIDKRARKYVRRQIAQMYDSIIVNMIGHILKYPEHCNLVYLHIQDVIVTRASFESIGKLLDRNDNLLSLTPPQPSHNVRKNQCHTDIGYKDIYPHNILQTIVIVSNILHKTDTGFARILPSTLNRDSTLAIKRNIFPNDTMDVKNHDKLFPYPIEKSNLTMKQQKQQNDTQNIKNNLKHALHRYLNRDQAPHCHFFNVSALIKKDQIGNMGYNQTQAVLVPCDTNIYNNNARHTSITRLVLDHLSHNDPTSLWYGVPQLILDGTETYIMAHHLYDTQF